ncbi:MAG: hypothetical protein QOD26_3188 [Betaproteobacteria bacterium]|jgi:hypothetical protein|nr:hypothetical protein [Betaproteobacteria bacterium]
MCGAGTSFGLIPLPRKIIEDFRAEAEKDISAFTGKPFPALRVKETDWDALYVWAEQARDELVGATHPCPKLKIAQALRLTSDGSWLAGVTRPVSKSMPRHRVIARFAREDRLQSIWTFNWDCHIEAALESVGLKEEEDVKDQPWPMRYHRVLGLAEYGRLPAGRTIFVHKRHGCIKRIKELEVLDLSKKATAQDYAAIQLRITKDELDNTPDKTTNEYRSFRGQLDTEFSGCPLMVCGWSASEKYILDELESSKDQLRTYPIQNERLSVLDPIFNSDGHTRLGAIYDIATASAHFPILPAVGKPDIDELFLWMQTLYALGEVHKVLTGHPALQVWIRAQIDAATGNTSISRITRWIDGFLPAWVQLCWRAGLVTASHRNRVMNPDEIRLEGEDWYVPLSQNLPQRPELITASYLLKATVESASEWRFDLVTGGMYCDTKAQLILPIPGWEDTADLNVLNSFTRILTRLSAVRGFVNELLLLPLGRNSDPLPDSRKARIKAAFDAVAGLPSSGRSLRVVNLQDI